MKRCYFQVTVFPIYSNYQSYFSLKFLISGYAEDGGLYFPESIPKLEQDEIEAMAKMTYPEMVKTIMSKFISESEIPSNDLSSLIDRAFKKFSSKRFIGFKLIRFQ